MIKNSEKLQKSSLAQHGMLGASQISAVKKPRQYSEAVEAFAFGVLHFLSTVQMLGEAVAFSNLLRRAVKVLGTKSGHEKDIEDVVWKYATEANGTNGSKVVGSFLKTLDGLGATTYHFIAPNYAVHFTEGIRELVIGPVRALLSTELVPSLAHDNKNAHLEFSDRQESQV